MSNAIKVLALTVVVAVAVSGLMSMNGVDNSNTTTGGPSATDTRPPAITPIGSGAIDPIDLATDLTGLAQVNRTVTLSTTVTVPFDSPLIDLVGTGNVIPINLDVFVPLGTETSMEQPLEVVCTVCGSAEGGSRHYQWPLAAYEDDEMNFQIEFMITEAHAGKQPVIVTVSGQEYPDIETTSRFLISVGTEPGSIEKEY